MKNQFVTYEIALKLKELGFAEQCWFQYYEDNLDYCYKYEKKATNIITIRTACLAPLWQQVIDWFREKYSIYISIIPHGETEHALKIKYNTSTLIHGGYKKYEEAREQAILKAIELCQKK